MSGGCPKVGNFSDQKWGVSVIAVTGSMKARHSFRAPVVPLSQALLVRGRHAGEVVKL